MRRPNFFVGGAAQSGTSNLALSLMQHPAIYMPREIVPEPHFFLKSAAFAQGLSNYIDRFFPDVGDEIAVGEKSSSYLYGGRLVAERIEAATPGAKIIFILRNPVDRVVSNYRFSVLNGLEDLSLEHALLAEDARRASASGVWREIQPYDYTGRSRYASGLAAFLDVLGAENVLTLKMESFRAEPELGWRQVFSFLGVDPEFRPAPTKDFHTPTVKDPARQTAIRNVFGDRFGQIIRAVRSGGDPMPHARTPQEKAEIKALVENLGGAEVPASTRARRLIQEKIAEDLSFLQKLVPFNLSDWGNPNTKASE